MSDSPATDPLSPWEQAFERFRARAGLVLAPILFVALLAWPMPGLKPEAQKLAAVMACVVVLWISEAIPMPATALAGAALCVLLKVAPAKEVFSPFADPLMFLFIGSFILARAIFLHGLDRRLAFGVLSLGWVGARPGRILFAYGAVTTCMSAFISNTATTAMMFAIGMSLLGFLMDRTHEGAGVRRAYATGLMLMTSFGASIGGLATPIGTPPNLIGLGFIRQNLNIEITFAQWSLLGVPVVALLFLFLFGYLNFFCRAGVSELAGSRELLARERSRLGPWTAGQISTLVAFGLTICLWVVPGIVGLLAGATSELYKSINGSLPEAVAAILGALLLFLLPGNRQGKAITWQDASQIDWGVVLLYGGGFALGTLSNSTGLAAAIGRSLTDWLPVSGPLGILIASTLVAALVSEATSNTASATIVVPVVIAVARAAGVDELAPALGATFGSSLGFMLPVSTPCNAIVYGSGMIPLSRMIRYGILLDVAGVIVVVTLVWFLLPWVR